jgi:hypothetical protein
MKILITGMSSTHTSPRVHQNNLGFVGVLNEVLSDSGHDIDWLSPDVTWTKDFLETYDAIFLGITPPTSLSANKVYGALNILDLMYDSPKLKMVLDAPQYWLFDSSLKSVIKNPDSLVKPFYSKRSQFEIAKTPEVLSRLVDACSRLLNEPWPITAYPSLPWKQDSDIESLLPKSAAGSLIGLNFDAKYLSNSSEESVDRQSWAADHLDTEWTRSVLGTISKPVEKLRELKSKTDSDVKDKLMSSIGALLSPERGRGGTWWSYNYVQALNTSTPIATEWRESEKISKHWSYLASHIESMTEGARNLLALNQKNAYIDSIPELEESVEILTNLIESSKEK